MKEMNVRDTYKSRKLQPTTDLAHIRFDSDLSICCFLRFCSAHFFLLSTNSDEDDYGDAYAKPSLSLCFFLHSDNCSAVSDGTRMNNLEELTIYHRNKENTNSTILFNNSLVIIQTTTTKESTKQTANSSKNAQYASFVVNFCHHVQFFSLFAQIVVSFTLAFIVLFLFFFSSPFFCIAHLCVAAFG